MDRMRLNRFVLLRSQALGLVELISPNADLAYVVHQPTMVDSVHLEGG